MMNQEEERDLYVGITEAPVFFCTPRSTGGTFTLRMEVKLLVQISVPDDKMACVLDKQKDWPLRVQNCLGPCITCT